MDNDTRRGAGSRRRGLLRAKAGLASVAQPNHTRTGFFPAGYRLAAIAVVGG